MRTKNEFVQRGEYDEDDDDGYDVQDNPGGSTEDEVTITLITDKHLHLLNDIILMKK